jgi:excisionase family DNA binding protein
VVRSREEREPTGNRDHDQEDPDHEPRVETPKRPDPDAAETAGHRRRAHDALRSTQSASADPHPDTMRHALRRIETYPEDRAVAERPRFLQPAEVAELLNVTVSQVYTLMRSGELAAVKIGKRGVWRVSPDALDGYITRLEREAAARRATS